MNDGIATRIRQTLKECGLTQSALASHGLPQRSVQNYALGKQKPGSDALIKLHNATGVNIHWLLTGTGEQFASDAQMKPRRLDIEDVKNLYSRFTDFGLTFKFREHSTRNVELVREYLAKRFSAIGLDVDSLTDEQAGYLLWVIEDAPEDLDIDVVTRAFRHAATNRETTPVMASNS
jgi:transcriptional regulator with XRE-family HTH domain